MDKNLKMFIDEIEEERINKGWTRRRLSIEAFNSQSSYHNILNGFRSPQYKSLKKLANALGLEIIVCLGDDIK